MKKFFKYLFSVLIIGLILTGCSKVSPEVMKESIYTVTPDEKKKSPVVFFFQGSGGSNGRAYDWSSWFEKHGVASVIIDNARVRNMKRLYGINYGSDLSVALDVVKDNPELDLSRYALMGFSRGGTAALEAANFLTKEQPEADLVFSLYPGDSKGCPNSHDEDTNVMVFYGELDDWGSYKGIRNTCKSMTTWSDSSSFHLLKDAHHGYDGSWSGKWSCCGGRTFTSEPNTKATEETRKLILAAMKKKWNL